ncbi:hypothetical protein MFRU_017g00530 [Monilinia fructicola]|nr:hypothetical protein MFRU_017g00530 [Monilinia fructicola]
MEVAVASLLASSKDIHGYIIPRNVAVTWISKQSLKREPSNIFYEPPSPLVRINCAARNVLTSQIRPMGPSGMAFFLLDRRMILMLLCTVDRQLISHRCHCMHLENCPAERMSCRVQLGACRDWDLVGRIGP